MLYSVAMKEYLTDDTNEWLKDASDEELLAASIKTPAIFARLVQKYEAPFMRKALSIIHDEGEAEDIVQEACMKIYLNAAKFKVVEGAQFSSWAYRILINTALSHYAKRKRMGQHTVELDDEIWDLIPDKNLRQFERRQFEDEVASVLTRMPPLFANVLRAFFIEGKPQEEIARDEGVSVGAIKTRVHRAKREFERIYKAITINN
ncbi:MAG: polymerase sigma-70 factor, subfamily [Patescibacteria group bacterium]|nr:polymerase sigma-70 factor, subfamily [Patescibacteria group bacterium]